MRDAALNRREWLKVMGVASVATGIGGDLFAADSAWKEKLLRYLAQHKRVDGGYAWIDQEDAHLTPTFAVIGCYQLLGQMPPEAKGLAGWVRTHHPLRKKKPEQEIQSFLYQQVQSLVWLGDKAEDLHAKVQAMVKPYRYLPQYEKHSYPVFEGEMTAFVGRELLGLSLTDIAQEFIDYLNIRWRINGSFNSTPNAKNADGNVLNTWWGLQAMRALKRQDEKREASVTWLRECQQASGGFTYQPDAKFGALDDVAYTRAALRSLKLLKAEPANREACIKYLFSLWNEDGGFGDRPGWLSNPVATYYALDALNALGALDNLTKQTPRTASLKKSLPKDLKIWSMQIEAHGQGSPTEAVLMAKSLGIHMWGAKNASAKWLAKAQALADEQKVPVKFFVANEEYGTWVDIPGYGTYSHTSDIIAPAGASIGDSLAQAGDVSWEEFRERRWKPLENGQGRLIWQFGENEALVRVLLDDSIQRGGFAAISTFHFGNPRFTNTSPWLMRYRGQTPFVALHDAHGPEPWWFGDMTEGFRTLFLAKEPTWEGWLAALKNNWVAAVRRDANSEGKLWMHAGSDEVAAFVKQNETAWRWWDNPNIQRPLASIVIVRPEDELEAGRPESGVNIRVRCQWENTTQGAPKTERVQLMRLLIDDKEVAKKEVRKGTAPKLVDVYHECPLGELKPGKHRVTGELNIPDGGRMEKVTQEFVIM
ncbi:MAG: prenyltransferase/squalene oxidase repeat-containing protein [Verrucomicrobiota bacterium]